MSPLHNKSTDADTMILIVGSVNTFLFTIYDLRAFGVNVLFATCSGVSLAVAPRRLILPGLGTISLDFCEFIGFFAKFVEQQRRQGTKAGERCELRIDAKMNREDAIEF
jgi:hypothetical protein